MKLEEAVSKVEQVNKFRRLCYDSLDYFNSRLQYFQDFGSGERQEFQGKLKSGLVLHHNFYDFVSVMDEWAKSEPPNPEDYGANAKKWLKAEKRTNYGLWTMLGGYGVGGVTSAAGFLIIGLPLLVTGGIGAIAIQHYRYKTDMLKSEGDASGFIHDLATYIGRDKYFSKFNIKFLRESMALYTDSLKDLANFFEKHNSSDEINALKDNYIEVQAFAKCLDDVISAIRKSKKHPILSWGGGISPAIITSESNMNISHLKRNFENLEKSTSDLVDM